MFGINMWVSIISVSVLTGLYTIIGGLMAVVLTESIQTVILLIGAICITTIGFVKVGGWPGLSEAVEPVKLTILRPKGDASGLPWYSVFLGYPVIGLWYWCADQTIVQRVLGAKDENHARVGALFAGFIKILPVFIFVLPGLICLGLINQGKLPATLDDSADTYAFLIAHLLPIGLKGLVAAALMAALMSTVSGALNSIATLFSYDIYRRWKPETPDHQLVLAGRIATFIAMMAAMLWSPMLEHFESIFQGIVTLICYIAPPISAVFVLGLFWHKASSTGAIITLWIGFVAGFITFLMDWFREFTHWNVPSMLMTFYLFVFCCAILTLVSFWKPQALSAEAEKVVWRGFRDALGGVAWPGFANYRFLAALLFIVMVGLYIVFR